MILGNASRNGGIRLEKIQVSFFGRSAKRCRNTPLVGHESAFQQQSEEPIEFRNLLEKLLLSASLQEQQLGVFQGIDIVGRWLACQDAVWIADPPILDCKLDDMLFAFIVDRIASQAAPDDKGVVLAYLTFLQEKLALPELLRDEERCAPLELFIRQFDALEDMCTEKFEHHSWLNLHEALLRQLNEAPHCPGVHLDLR